MLSAHAGVRFRASLPVTPGGCVDPNHRFLINLCVRIARVIRLTLRSGDWSLLGKRFRFHPILLEKEGSEMGTYKGKLTLLSLGAVLAVITALALSVAGPQGLAQEEKAPKASALPEGGGGCCSAKGGGECCSTKGGDCHCAKNLLAKAEQEKPKEKMKMASPEAMAKGATARKAIIEHQKALTGEGIYGCCIKPGCAFCSTSADMCPCAMNLAKGGPVCPECWGGWTAGKGNLPGVKAEDVQVIPKSKLKMMYDMRSKNFGEASEKK